MNSTEDMVNGGRQLCAFVVDQYCFGIDVRQVHEVLRFQEMTHVPLAPPVVGGLINLRGQIVMAIDLRHRLELPDRNADRLPVNVIIRTADGVVSLLVDALYDVIRVPDEACEQPPDTMNALERELITACYRLEDRLLLVLDTEKLADITQQVEDSLKQNLESS